MSEVESATGGSRRDQHGLRFTLIALPFLITFPVLLTNEVSGAETGRYFLWTLGWWFVGLALTAALPRLRSRMSLAAVGGIFGVAAQLIAWVVAVPVGHCGLVLPALLIMSLIGTVVSSRMRSHVIEVFSASSRHPANTTWHPVPTYALGAWSAFSLWLLAGAQAFFRDNSFSPHRAAAMQDLFWHLGIVGQLKSHVIPPVSESDTGTYLNYHWLSDAFMASGSLGSHVPAIMVAERLWLIPVLLLTAAFMVVVTREITGTFTSVIPALLIVSFSTTLPILSWQGLGPSTTFLFLSPSQIFGIPMMLFALFLITQYWRSTPLTWTSALGLITVFLLCAGSKSSILPVFIGGMTMTLLGTAAMDEPVRRELRIKGGAMWLCAVIAEIIALPLFAGGSAGSQIRLVGHLRRWSVVEQLTHHAHGMGHGPFLPPGLSLLTALVITLLVVLLIASYGVGSLSIALGRRIWASDPLPAFLAFSILASIVAFCLIDHTGESESYFPMGAMPLLAILTGWGYATIWHRQVNSNNAYRGVRGGILLAVVLTAVNQHFLPHTLPRHALLAWWLGWPILMWVTLAALGAFATRRGHGVFVATALIGVGVLWPAWQALRATVPDLTRPAPKASTSSVYANEQDALRWIRDHTPSDAIVATNVHCHDVIRESHCDSSAYWTNGLAERRFFIGSWGYTDGAQRNAGIDGYIAVQQSYPNQSAYRLNEAMFYAPNTGVARQLYAKGVRWLFADGRVAPLSPKIETFAQRVGTWGNVRVYKLPR